MKSRSDMRIIVTLGAGCISGRRSRIEVAVRGHIRWRSIELVVATGHLDGTKHRLGEIDRPAVLKHHLEADPALESTVLLRRHIALDEVGPEHGLLHFDTGQCYEWGAEREEGIGCLLVVENHSMRRQVDASHLLALEFVGAVPCEVDLDVVAEQQDPEKGVPMQFQTIVVKSFF